MYSLCKPLRQLGIAARDTASLRSELQRYEWHIACKHLHQMPPSTFQRFRHFVSAVVTNTSAPRAVLSLLLTFAMGCLTENDTAHDQQGIYDGVEARDHKEVVMVDSWRAEDPSLQDACTGTLIAPRVVLTAGHCVVGWNRHRVKAQYANNEVRESKVALTRYEQKSPNELNGKSLDLAVIVLDEGIQLPAYPTFRHQMLTEVTAAYNVGRRLDGQISSREVYRSATHNVEANFFALLTFPYSYISGWKSRLVDMRDSGGPVMRLDSPDHEIVGVCSGMNPDYQVIARTDVAAAEIDAIIRANGGYGETPTVCLFNWAQAQDAARFPANAAPPQENDAYVYRYYQTTKSYLGVHKATHRVHHLDANGVLHDLGDANELMRDSGCR